MWSNGVDLRRAAAQSKRAAKPLLVPRRARSRPPDQANWLVAINRVKSGQAWAISECPVFQ